MEKNKEKNGFLITCISCIVLLLVMFYFGISNSLKGTQSAGCTTSRECKTYIGTSGEGDCTLSDDGITWSCCKEVTVCDDTEDGTDDSGNTGDFGGSGDSGCLSASACLDVYSYCKQDNNGCYVNASIGNVVPNCPSGQVPNSAGMCVTCDSGNVIDGVCVFEPSSPDSSNPLYTCDGGKTTQTSDICDEKKGSEWSHEALGTNIECSIMYGDGWEGQCEADLNSYWDGDNKPLWRYDCDCVKPATLYVEDDTPTFSCNYDSKTNCELSSGESCSEDSNGCYVPSTSSCTYSNYFACSSATGDTCIEINGCYYSPALNDGDMRSCSSIKGSVTGGYYSGMCIYRSYGWTCASCALTCGYGYTPSGGECVPCSGSDCESCDEEPACYYDASSGYCWGNSESCSGSVVDDKDSSTCHAPSVPTSPSDPTPSDPDDPDNPSPSNSSGTSSSKPGSSSNITENPPTGQIAIFVVWVVALASIIYSVWYFKKVKES